MTRSTRRALLAGVLVAISAAVAFEWLWTSDEERVVAALDGLQAALERRDADAVEPWVAPGATFPAGVPGAAAGGALHDGLATLFRKIEALKLRRDETTITFGDDRAATVVAKGSGKVDIPGHGDAVTILFTFEVEAHFEREPDDRYLLDRIVRVRVDPGFR